MKQCTMIQINGDHQNSFIVGQRSKGVFPTRIEEIALEYENSIDREYQIYEDDKLVAVVVNVPVVVFYAEARPFKVEG